MNTDRDPADQAAVATAVCEWLDSNGVGGDDPLHNVLLQQGVLADHDSYHIEYGCREHDVVHIYIEGEGWIQIDRNGVVEKFPD